MIPQNTLVRMPGGRPWIGYHFILRPGGDAGLVTPGDHGITWCTGPQSGYSGMRSPYPISYGGDTTQGLIYTQYGDSASQGFPPLSPPQNFSYMNFVIISPFSSTGGGSGQAYITGTTLTLASVDKDGLEIESATAVGVGSGGADVLTYTFHGNAFWSKYSPTAYSGQSPAGSGYSFSGSAAVEATPTADGWPGYSGTSGFNGSPAYSAYSGGIGPLYICGWHLTSTVDNGGGAASMTLLPEIRCIVTAIY